MHIAIGCDHGGFELKEYLKEQLAAGGNDVQDYGCFSGESVDYPDYAAVVTNAVLRGDAMYGILICGTGIGICMAANKFKGIRAALCTSVYMAEMTRKHNDANILCLGGRTTEPKLALDITRTFLTTEFEGGRHQRRIDKLEQVQE